VNRTRGVALLSRKEAIDEAGSAEHRKRRTGEDLAREGGREPGVAMRRVVVVGWGVRVCCLREEALGNILSFLPPQKNDIPFKLRSTYFDQR